MRIATWNINGLRARFDFLLHWLRVRQPDIVGLQELKVDEEHFPYAELEAQGYFAVAETQKAWNGVAVLSRRQADPAQKGLPGQEDLGARLVSTRLADLHYINIYCPNGKSVEHPDFGKKLAWLDGLAKWLDAEHQADEPIILCGDFNICPTGRDSWNEEKLGGNIFHTDQERARFQRLLDWGLVDIFRERFPQEQKFSWWDYRGGAFHQNLGLRIDFLLASRPLMDRVEAVEIDRDYRKKKEGLTASDHAPVLARLRD